MQLAVQMETRLLVGTYGEKLVHVHGKGKGVYAYNLRIKRNQSGDIVANLQNAMGTGARVIFATPCILTRVFASSCTVSINYYHSAIPITTNE